MARIGCRHMPTLIPAVLLLGLGIAFCPGRSGAQAPQQGVRVQGDAVEDPLKIKVEVDEVRIDAVVVDGKGKQITDLTVDDFEVYQDGKRQEITSCRYISQDRSSSVEKQTTEQESLPLIPVPKLKREKVQRSIVVLVNDFSMEFEDVYNTRMALRKYVTEQIQPGDLLSLIKTSRGSATLQAFSSDKRELLARIDNIQWNTSIAPLINLSNMIKEKLWNIRQNQPDLQSDS